MQVENVLVYSFRKIVVKKNIQRNGAGVCRKSGIPVYGIMFVNDGTTRRFPFHHQKFVLRRIRQKISQRGIQTLNAHHSPGFQSIFVHYFVLRADDRKIFAFRFGFKRDFVVKF